MTTDTHELGALTLQDLDDRLLDGREIPVDWLEQFR